MFQVLITTTYWASSGCALQTRVVSFNTLEAARDCVKVVNTTPTGSDARSKALLLTDVPDVVRFP